MSRTVFHDGWLADVAVPALRRGDLLVENGQIAAISADLTHVDATMFDLHGLILAPGFVDLHVHLREPGYEYKETIVTGCQAAAAGGFTTIACMPNTQPVLDTAERINWVKDRASAQKVKVLPIGAISRGQGGAQPVDYVALRAAGAVAFSDDGRGVMNSHLMLQALQSASELQVPIIAHEEDAELAGAGSINAGSISNLLHDAGIPAIAEYAMLARDICLAEYAGAHLHVAHVSCKESVQLIRFAKERGVRVTAEVTPHHLSLTETIVSELLGKAKVNPPLRTEEDKTALRTALADGTIDIIATDHAPHAMSEKNMPLSQAAFGFSGLEVAFAVAQAAMVESGIMELAQLLSAMSYGPASILGLPQGRLAIGAPADLIVLDPNCRWQVTPEALYSQGKNTPYLGKELLGRVLLTMIDGQVVLDNWKRGGTKQCHLCSRP